MTIIRSWEFSNHRYYTLLFPCVCMKHYTQYPCPMYDNHNRSQPSWYLQLSILLSTSLSISSLCLFPRTPDFHSLCKLSSSTDACCSHQTKAWVDPSLQIPPIRVPIHCFPMSFLFLHKKLKRSRTQHPPEIFNIHDKVEEYKPRGITSLLPYRSVLQNKC